MYRPGTMSRSDSRRGIAWTRARGEYSFVVPLAGRPVAGSGKCVPAGGRRVPWHRVAHGDAQFPDGHSVPAIAVQALEPHAPAVAPFCNSDEKVRVTPGAGGSLANSFVTIKGCPQAQIQRTGELGLVCEGGPAAAALRIGFVQASGTAHRRSENGPQPKRSHGGVIRLRASHTIAEPRLRPGVLQAVHRNFLRPRLQHRGAHRA